MVQWICMYLICLCYLFNNAVYYCVNPIWLPHTCTGRKSIKAKQTDFTYLLYTKCIALYSETNNTPACFVQGILIIAFFIYKKTMLIHFGIEFVWNENETRVFYGATKRISLKHANAVTHVFFCTYVCVIDFSAVLIHRYK